MKVKIKIDIKKEKYLIIIYSNISDNENLDINKIY